MRHKSVDQQCYAQHTHNLQRIVSNTCLNATIHHDQSGDVSHAMELREIPPTFLACKQIKNVIQQLQSVENIIKSLEMFDNVCKAFQVF